MGTEIRPMSDADADEMARLWARTWRELERSLGGAGEEADEAAIERSAARFAHLFGTDPGGSMVAEVEGTLVGLAAGLRRGDTYVLANLCVAPEHQERGLGRELLASALAYGEGTSRGLICSSPDPRAVQRYVRAGFRVSPTMAAHGRPGATGRSSLRLSEGAATDLALVDELDRRTRGVARTEDVAHLLASGAALWVDDDGAYAVVRGGGLTMLGAAGPTLAARALAGLLSGVATGEPVTAHWLTDATPWAFEAAAEVRARCVGWGALMLRGEWPGRRSYLPSGAFG